MEFNLTRECFSWMVFGEPPPDGSYNAEVEILWGKNIRFVHSEKEEEEEERGGGGWTAVKAVKYQSRDGSCHRRANIMGGVLN